MEVLWTKPKPQAVPFPIKNDEVKLWGFDLDKPSLPQKIVQNLTDRKSHREKSLEKAKHEGVLQDCDFIDDNTVSNQEKAILYNYLYRPRQDKITFQTRKKKEQTRVGKGLAGSPVNSKQRMLSKIFDYQRKKSVD